MINSINLDLPWWKATFLVLDLEGTGSQHREREEIVEVAAVRVEGRQLTGNFYYRLIQPRVEIPPLISRIHGLRNEDVNWAPFFESIETELLSLLNYQILVGHHVRVDYNLLKLKMPRYSPSLILDTRILAKYLWSEERHTLDALIEKFRVEELLRHLPLTRGRHSAFYDAYATALIFLRLLEEGLPENTTLGQLAGICSYPTNQITSNQQPLF